MKNVPVKIAIIIGLILGLFPGLNQAAQAQSDKEEIELYQAAFGMEKKEIIAGFLKLDENNPFWAIYDEYETKRKELGKKRIELLKKYTTNYDNMSDAMADEIIKEIISQRKSTDKLIETYYGKVKKASGSKVAAQFYEIENYVLSGIRAEILESIPFIGELDK